MLYLKTDFISYLIQLPQTKADFLLKNKIQIRTLKDKEDKKDQKPMDVNTNEYFNYIKLWEASLNYHINLQNVKSFYKLMEFLNLRVVTNSILVVFESSEALETFKKTPKGIQILLDNFCLSTKLVFKPVI